MALGAYEGRRAPGLGPRCCAASLRSGHTAAALGPDFGYCAAAAASWLRLGRASPCLGVAAPRLVGADLFAMGQIGTQETRPS